LDICLKASVAQLKAEASARGINKLWNGYGLPGPLRELQA